ncbi:MAG: hypothetical protein ACO33E_06010 [Aquiluna sp.]
MNPLEIHERLVAAGESWATAQEAAELLEETRKPLISQLGLECSESSAAAKEAYALRHPDYDKHIKMMVKNRAAANKARVRWESAKIYAELLRTQAANERATMRSAT